MEDYSEYLIQGEPDKRDRVRNWMADMALRKRQNIWNAFSEIC